MKHVLEFILFTFLLTAITQANAGVSSCNVLAASDAPQDSQQAEGDKKKDDKKKDGKKKTGADDEAEPDCD